MVHGRVADYQSTDVRRTDYLDRIGRGLFEFLGVKCLRCELKLGIGTKV